MGERWQVEELDLLNRYFTFNASLNSLFQRLLKLNRNRTFEGMTRKRRHMRAKSGYLTSREEAESRLRVGYLDIESTGLEGDWDMMLCWYIKVAGKNEYRSGVVKPDEMHDYGKRDKRIVKELLAALDEFDVLYVHYGCMAEGSRILTADLRWVPVESLGVGDKLVGFDAEGKGGRRCYRVCEVTHNVPVKRPCFKLTFSDNTSVVVSEEHPFLRRNGRGCNIWTTPHSISGWFASKKAAFGRVHFNRQIPLWSPDQNGYAAGYLAGMFDGEGSLHQHNYNRERSDQNGKYGRYGMTLAFTQADNPALHKAWECLDAMGFDYRVSEQKKYKDTHKTTYVTTIRGTASEYMRLLGTCRPERLIDKFDAGLLGSVQSHEHGLYLENIEYVGFQKVYSLATTTHTYVGEGFLSHNSDRRFDIPFIRTRALGHGLHNELKSLKEQKFIRDTWLIARLKLKMSSNRLERLQDFLGVTSRKTRLKPQVWVRARMGYKKDIEYVADHCKADVLVLEQVHKKLEPVERKTYVGW